MSAATWSSSARSRAHVLLGRAEGDEGTAQQQEQQPETVADPALRRSTAMVHPGARWPARRLAWRYARSGRSAALQRPGGRRRASHRRTTAVAAVATRVRCPTWRPSGPICRLVSESSNALTGLELGRCCCLDGLGDSVCTWVRAVWRPAVLFCRMLMLFRSSNYFSRLSRSRYSGGRAAAGGRGRRGPSRLRPWWSLRRWSWLLSHLMTSRRWMLRSAMSAALRLRAGGPWRPGSCRAQGSGRRRGGRYGAWPSIQAEMGTCVGSSQRGTGFIPNG